MRAASRFEWSYINETGVLSLFYKGLRVIWAIHLFAFGGCWLPATATILFSFSPDLLLTLLTHFGLCVLCVLRHHSQSQIHQIKKCAIKRCFPESIFTSLPPFFFSRSPYLHSVQCPQPRPAPPTPWTTTWRRPPTKTNMPTSRRPKRASRRSTVRGCPRYWRRKGISEEGGFYVFAVGVIWETESWSAVTPTREWVTVA